LLEHILDDYDCDYDPHIFFKDHRDLNNRFNMDFKISYLDWIIENYPTELIEKIENKYKVILNLRGIVCKN
jgi:hypothetical protein